MIGIDKYPLPDRVIGWLEDGVNFDGLDVDLDESKQKKLLQIRNMLDKGRYGYNLRSFVLSHSLVVSDSIAKRRISRGLLYEITCMGILTEAELNNYPEILERVNQEEKKAMMQYRKRRFERLRQMY